MLYCYPGYMINYDYDPLDKIPLFMPPPQNDEAEEPFDKVQKRSIPPKESLRYFGLVRSCAKQDRESFL